MTRLFVKVKPNAASNRIEGWLGEVLKVSLKAKPEGGEANRMLVKFVAGELAISKDLVQLKAGWTSRTKIVEIDLTVEEIKKKLSKKI